MRQQLFTIVVAFIIALVLLLYLFSFQVRETELAIVTTFGAPSRVITEPGLYWKLPWPVQKVERYDGRIQVFEDRMDETLTRDKKNVLVTACVGWRVAPDKEGALLFRRSTVTFEAAKRNLLSLVGDRKSDVIGRYDLANFVSVDPKQMQFEKIESEMLAAVAPFAREKYGLEVVLFRIKRLELPSAATDAVQNRMKEERNTEVEKFRAEGQAEAQQIRSEAERQRKNIVAMANAEAQRIRGEGEAEVAKYSKIFAEQPELANWLRTIRAVENITKTRTTVVLDSRNTLLEAITRDIHLPDAAHVERAVGEVGAGKQEAATPAPAPASKAAGKQGG